MKLFI